MNHVAAMREARRHQDLLGDRDRTGRVERGFARDHLLERGALAVLHRDVVGAVELAAVIDPDDVRMLKPGRRGGLAAEALDELLVLREARMQQLDRDLAPEM